jgi:hypothetical protein
MTALFSVAARAAPWLVGAFICCLIATYIATVLVALLHSDAKRRADARSVLDRHMFTAQAKRHGLIHGNAASSQRLTSHDRSHSMGQSLSQPSSGRHQTG